LPVSQSFIAEALADDGTAMASTAIAAVRMPIFLPMLMPPSQVCRAANLDLGRE
jgi:hypothetical protein